MTTKRSVKNNNLQHQKHSLTVILKINHSFQLPAYHLDNHNIWLKTVLFPWTIWLALTFYVHMVKVKTDLNNFFVQKRIQSIECETQSGQVSWQQRFPIGTNSYNGKGRLQLFFETMKWASCCGEKQSQRKKSCPQFTFEHCARLWMNTSSCFTKWLPLRIHRTEKTVWLCCFTFWKTQRVHNSSPISCKREVGWEVYLKFLCEP